MTEVAIQYYEHILVNWEDYIWALSIVVGAYILGRLLQMVLVGRLGGRLPAGPLKIVLESARGLLPLGAAVFGLYVLSELGRFEAIHNFAAKSSSAIITIVFTLYFARVGGRMAAAYGDVFGGQSLTLLSTTVRTIIFGIGILFVMQSIGISITPLLTALGVGGLAVALALQDTLGNLFAGLQLVATKRYRQGDFVELSGGQKGYISDISWRNTTLRTIHNNLVIIPNSKFGQEVILNFNFPQGDFVTPVTVGVHYDSDLDFVEKVTLEVAESIESQFSDLPYENSAKPFMWYHTFGPSSIDFNVMLRAGSYQSHFRLKHEFIKALMIRYRQEDIEIPFPIRNLYFRNNLQATQTHADPRWQPETESESGSG